MADREHWVGAWTIAPAPAEGIAFNNITLRMKARISLGGRVLRVRFSNAHGTRPLQIGAAWVGRQQAGPSIMPGTHRQLTFGNEASALVAAGSLLVSDPVELDVPLLSDLLVSVHLPQDLPASFCITGRYARVTNYISPLGDFAAQEVMPVGKITDDCYFLAGIDVAAEPGTGAIVAFGDSLTDGNLSTHDAYANWPNQLARRLVGQGRRIAVMNQGLGGNRLLHDVRGDSGLRRFDRDVLAQPGVTHVIVLLGINDLRNRMGLPEEEATTPALIGGLRQLALRAHAHGLTMYAGTLTPWENETFTPNAWTPAREAVRQAVNTWIRTGEAFDGVIDFDAAVRDPEHPTSMLPAYDCGDHLHQSDRGYNHMGDVIDLALFD
ncbi:MAG TPA: SGNH/GDSL hydrolase family protein [Rhodopila sp.]|nr:SGNH/GDSL hydrolase family protein [Rhodopila sp.]